MVSAVFDTVYFRRNCGGLIEANIRALLTRQAGWYFRRNCGGLIEANIRGIELMLVRGISAAIAAASLKPGR